MNQKLPEIKTFNFVFPITDFNNHPAEFVGNLDVKASAEILNGDTLKKVKILKIIAFDNNIIGVTITDIIKAIAPDIYQQMQDNANELAEEMVREKFAIPQL